MTESENAITATNVDVSFWKMSVIGVLGVILAGVSGFFLKTLISSGENFLPVLFSAGGFVAVFLLQIIFIKSPRNSNSIIILESFVMAAPFLIRYSAGVLAAWLGLLFFFWAAARAGRAELDNQMKIKFWRIGHLTATRVFTALAIFISILYVWVNQGSPFTKERFQSLIKPAQPLIQRYLVRDFSFNMTISKFVGLIVENRLGGAGVALTPALKAQMVNQTLAEFQNQYGVILKPNEAVGDTIYGYVIDKINKAPAKLQAAIPFGTALFIFLTVKSIAIVLGWLIIPATYILYELAMLTGFATKMLESRSREIVMLK